MLGGMSVTKASLTLLNTSPGELEAWATARSMLRALAITSAAGTPLPVASPTTTPSWSSQRCSSRLSAEWVAAVGEPAPRVLRAHRVQSPADGLQERLARPGLRLPQERLDLGEGLLDRREIRRVGRQEQQRAAPCFDEVAHPFAPVRAEVVQHHHLTRPQRRRQDPLYV